MENYSSLMNWFQASIAQQGDLKVEELRLPVKRDQSNGCKCKRSKCIKLYCECFASRYFCTNCSCLRCLNKPNRNKLRKRKIDELIEKTPDAFSKREIKRSCKCTKSNCSKKYCECYRNEEPCSQSCECLSCSNPIKII